MYKYSNSFESYTDADMNKCECLCVCVKGVLLHDDDEVDDASVSEHENVSVPGSIPCCSVCVLFLFLIIIPFYNSIYICLLWCVQV